MDFSVSSGLWTSPCLPQSRKRSLETDCSSGMFGLFGLHDVGHFLPEKSSSHVEIVQLTAHCTDANILIQSASNNRFNNVLELLVLSIEHAEVVEEFKVVVAQTPLLVHRGRLQRLFHHLNHLVVIR